MSNVSFCSPHLCVGFLFVILYPAAFSASSASSTIFHIPRIFVWGSCFWFCIPPPPPPPPPPLPRHPPSFTYNFVTHHLSHTTLSPTIFVTHNFVTHHLSHTIFVKHHLSHTNFVTHNLSHSIFVTHHLSHTIFVKHHLSHTTLSHTIFHTPSSHPPSFTHHFVTHHLSHTTLSHTIFHTPSLATCAFVSRGRCGTSWHPPSFWVAHHLSHTTLGEHVPSFHVAGVALRDIHLRFAWQAWHLWHWAGSGDALARAWSPVTPPNFAWQAWHLVTSPSFCVASVALMALGWLRWRAWARLGALGRRWRRLTLRGRRGTWRHPPSFRVAGRGTWSHPPLFCVAGVALGPIHLRIAWQSWQLWHRAGSGGALARAWSPVTPPNFAWQAWHLVTSPSFCVAGVVLGHIHRRFAWHLVTFTFHRSSPVISSWRRVSCFDFDPQWEEIGCQAEMPVPSLYSVHVLWRFTFSYPTMNFSYSAVTAVSDMLWCLCTASWDPAHCSFATHHLSYTALSHTTFHTQLSHTRSFTQNFVTYTIFSVAHHLSHTTLSTHNFSILHHLLCLSFLPLPLYNICCSLLEEVDLWGYPVL